MTPIELLNMMVQEAVVLELDDNLDIVASGPVLSVKRWLPLLRQRNADFLSALPLPGFAASIVDDLEERAGILQFEAGASRYEAEVKAFGMFKASTCLPPQIQKRIQVVLAARGWWSGQPPSATDTTDPCPF